MPLDKEKLELYADWSIQRLANDEDPRDVAAFVEHLRNINADWRVPHEYGLPHLSNPKSAVTEPSVKDSEGVDLWPLIKAVADRQDVPAIGLLALLEAESDLNPRAERWGSRTSEAMRCLDDTAKLRQLASEVWPDISFGLCQMTVATAKGYGIGDGTKQVGNILKVREALFDRGTAIEVGAKHFSGCIAAAKRSDPRRTGQDLVLGGLIVYNAGSLPPRGNVWWTTYAPNVRRYERALQWAKNVVEPGTA